MWYERRWETVTGAGPEPGAWGGSAEVPARPRVVAVSIKRFIICLFLLKTWSPSCYSLDNSIGNKPELFILDINCLPRIDETAVQTKRKTAINHQARERSSWDKQIIILEWGKGLDIEEQVWEKLCSATSWDEIRRTQGGVVVWISCQPSNACGESAGSTIAPRKRLGFFSCIRTFQWMKSEWVQCCMEIGLCLAGGREDGALTVDLSAQRFAGWQMVPGIGNGLSELGRIENLGPVLYKCLLLQQNAEILKYSPLETGLFQPWKAKLSRENAVVIARILPIHHLLLKANTNWFEKEPHVLS